VSAPRRLFVALMLGEAAGRELESAVRAGLGARPDSGGPRAFGVRWIGASDLHLTLFFLGAVFEEQRVGLEASIERAVQGRGVGELRLERAGAFPPGGRPRILWVGVRALLPELLRELQAQVHAACVGAGFRADEHPWTPHVTVGRVGRSRGPQGGIEAVPPEFFQLNLGIRWKPQAVSLVESVSAGGAPAYRSIRDFFLPLEAPEPS
jgi:RNA 2',3'-cyclic 3'-phosphodiesterase